MPKSNDNFRVYRVDKSGNEQRQDMIVGHPERGWVCATETSDNRAKQWAHIFSSNDSANTYEVREVATKIIQDDPVQDEFTVLRFRGGRRFL